MSGHSAGGQLAACMLVTDWPAYDASLPRDLVMAAYAISGLFELEPLVDTSVNKALRLDRAAARAASPLFWAPPAGSTLDAVSAAMRARVSPAERTVVEVWAKPASQPGSHCPRRQPLHRDRAARRPGVGDGAAAEAAHAALKHGRCVISLLRQIILSIK